MSASIERLNPQALPDAAKIGYSQITVSTPGRIAFVSGQVAWLADGSGTPQALAKQTAVVIGNLKAALAAIQATQRDILQMRIYLTELTPENQELVMEQLLGFLDGAMPSVTGLGVVALAAPDLKLEIEMTVQVPD